MAKYLNQNVKPRRAWLIEVEYATTGDSGKPLLNDSGGEVAYVKQVGISGNNGLTVIPAAFLEPSLELGQKLNSEIHFDDMAHLQLLNLVWHEERIEKIYYKRVSFAGRKWYAIRFYSFRATEIYIDIVDTPYAADGYWAPLPVTLFNDDILFIEEDEFEQRRVEPEESTEDEGSENMEEEQSIEEFFKDFNPVSLNSKFTSIENMSEMLYKTVSESDLLNSMEEISAPMTALRKGEIHHCYTIGLSLYQKGVETNEDEYFDHAILFFSAATSSDFLSYEKIGDCLMRKSEYQKALKMFMTKIHLENKRVEELNADSSIDEKPKYGECYFKVALCLKRLGRRGGLVKDFLMQSREQLTDYYEGFEDWGFADWEDVMTKFGL